MTTMMKIDEAPDIYCDSVLVGDGSRLLFISLWGRDTALQQFIARMQLGGKEGISRFRLRGEKDIDVWVPNANELEKNSGRMPPNLFGEITQMWLYDPVVQSPDRTNRRAIVIIRRAGDWSVELDGNDRVWSMICEICPIPLMTHWRVVLIRIFIERAWLKTHSGVGTTAFEINLSSKDVEHVITDLIREGILTLKEPTREVNNV